MRCPAPIVSDPPRVHLGLASLLPLALLACGGDAPRAQGLDSTVDALPAETSLPEVSSPDLALPPQPVAGACRAESDCETGYCNTHAANGYCTLQCAGDEMCPAGSRCISDIDSDGKRRKLCLKTCESDAGCRADQFCPTESKVCAARCQDGSCPDGQQCNLASGRCEREAPCSPLPERCDGLDQDCNGYIDEGCGPPIGKPPHVILHDLGEVSLGGEGLSRTFNFVPDPGSSSFTVVALGLDHPETYLTMYSLIGPDGVDLLGSGDPNDALNRTFPSFSAYTVQVPNRDTLAIREGRYSFSFFAFPDGDTPAPVGRGWVYILENTRTEPVASVMDVNFWFVGVPNLTASRAQNDAKFQRLVGNFRQLMANLGVTLGTIRYFDVGGADAQRLSIVDTGDSLGIDEHAELLSLSKTLPADNLGVSFFLVRGFTGWDLLGKAGGIPGPPMMHGTYNSGVAVSMSDYMSYPDEGVAIALTSQTMAHELGHQLGLFHTTEADGRMHDTISDTAECPASPNDRNRDGLVDPEECAALGGRNLMFWAATLEDIVSLGQRKVLHKNPTMQEP